MMHGLFGSSSNLLAMAKQLAHQRTVILPDLRNHGRSPHSEDVSYQSMAGDILELLDDCGYDTVDLLGHSMGGKVAMWLALHHPELVNHLIVADISPVNYTNRFADLLDHLCQLDMAALASRKDADQQLAKFIEEQSLRDYLLQNLIYRQGQWQWRMNLQALAQGIHQIVAFPETSAEYAKPVLFLKGEHSAYLADKYQAALYRLFPMAEIMQIQDAGHWLYAEQPQRFMAAIKTFCCR